MVQPIVWELDPVDFTDITPEAISAVTPNELRPLLMGVSSVTHESSVDGVALNAGEFASVPHSRNVADYGRTAGTRAVVRYSMSGSIERQRTKRDQHSRDSIERLLEKARPFNEQLKSEAADIARVREAAAHPGLVRRLYLDTWQALVSTRNITFANMLTVAGLHEGWTDDDAAVHTHALDYRLFMQRRNNEHIGNWRGMLDLARIYNRAKGVIFEDRIRRMERHLGIGPARTTVEKPHD